MFTLGPREVLIGLGSNSKDAHNMLRQARTAIRQHSSFKIKCVSPIYESDALLPQGAPSGWNRPFLNSVIRAELKTMNISSPADALATAEKTLKTLKDIEKSLGRVPAERWAPRIIDLDILDWCGPAIQSQNIEIPHPQLKQRPFAVLPGMDCAPLSGALGAEDAQSITSWRYNSTDKIPLRTRLAKEAWPELVGILNVTPDSFSDGNPAHTLDGLKSKVVELIQGGATVIDIGAESTRPGAVPVPAQVEYERLLPVLDAVFSLKRDLGFRVSLDCRNPATIRKILEKHEIDWINDVEGFSNPEMIELAAERACSLVVMHSLSVPPRPDRVLPATADPIIQILEWARRKIEELNSAGVSPARMIFDPGLGFGKTHAQNIAIACRATELCETGTKVLIGHSRKRFLDPFDTVSAQARDLESAMVTGRLARSGIDYLRVHDASANRRALRLGATLP